MQGLMMGYQLTIPAMLQRAEELFADKEISSRRLDRSFHRYTYADFASRSKKLAVALQNLGIRPGDRVATLCWNHHRHLEAYFGIPCAGAVLHTLNLRLAPDDLAYIIDHAGDRALLVDESLLPILEKVRDRVSVEHVVVLPEEHDGSWDDLDYEQLLEGAGEAEFSYTQPDENEACAMCYTSGTTGNPKGVVYSYRAIALHSLASAMAGSISIMEPDTVMPVVPMFHVNAWGIPFTATMVGARQVFPGPHLDPQSLLETLEAERVTLTAGVPTIWLGILQALDADPGGYDLSSLRMMAVGGSAAPEGMIRGFRERHGLHVLHAWGMTETTPIATVSTLASGLEEAGEDEQYAQRAKQGRPLPFIEIRARGEEGLVPWDGESMGELEIRGPWIASSYYDSTDDGDSFTDDGWFRTGDIVTIDHRGYIEIKDREKDLIKSGGEWISSVALENYLMTHSCIAEAAVIAIPHPTWQERPLAVAVLTEGESATAEDLTSHLAQQFPKWMLPDAVEFVEAIPRSSTGKFLKRSLRERFKDYTPSG